ncbi:MULTISPECIES: AlbA family DNA-binding domain-containing protein [Olivibacter]|uniref:Helix-turn-helix domain-containing protein n=1 Tax=Olivibacter jilunii TaxID=985016 RepID=A0ABW6B0X1_9SPHI|nr:ATP-binding protein [Pseudosphingobacterium sp.]
MEFNIDYLNSLIENQVEEHLNLDYKASGSLAKEDRKTIEISKDVSSFANSDGGLIIYGMREDAINRHLPSELDPIDREKISKEWLEQIINSKIRPRIDGLIVHPIPIGEKAIYIVEIPRSDQAHQADDKKYYKRFNFNCEPMYDYEIKDIMNRAKQPNVYLEFMLGTFIQHSAIDRQVYHLYCRAINRGSVLANYFNAKIELPTDILFQHSGRNNTQTINWSNQEKGNHPLAILPSLSIRKTLDVKIKSNYMLLDKEITWTAYADNAKPNIGKTKITELSTNHWI